MRFNDHSRLAGEHSFLSASKYSWLNYDESKLVDRYSTAQAAAFGTRLHALAAEHITLGMKMPRNNVTFNQYVNDAIGFRMTPEQVLFYSVNAFGTADAIRYDEPDAKHKGQLRIHDLKTGTTRVSIKQLEIYEAYFCLEYAVRPFDIDAELRIYQNDDILVHHPEPEEILYVMDKIVQFDKIIESLKEEGL